MANSSCYTRETRHVTDKHHEYHLILELIYDF
jgi:hypothetical protein